MTSSSFDPSKIAINHGLSWYTKQEGLSEECKGYLERMTYDDTLARAFFNQATKTEYTIGSEKCGQGSMGQISTAIQKFFIFLKGIKKYNDLYIQGSINKVANLQSNIHKTASAVAGILRTIIQRTRNWVLNKIKALVRNALDYFLTPIVKQAKEAVVDLMLDQIFCAFDRIIHGLIDLVGDFLYSLIGTVVNAPFCVAEKWTNSLISRVVSDIDKALAPLFNQINDLLGGVAKIAGSVMNVVNTILGFEGFFCKTPECPEVHNFSVSPWGGPTKAMSDNWNNFDFDVKIKSDFFDGFLGEEGNTSQNPGDCYSGSFECGVPQIVIFGGGGSGAVAQAVVNKIGQVIGSNVLNGGEGYSAPPFVSIIDPAGCGSNAAAYSVINDEGEVIEIVITSPGMDYDNTDVGGAPVINSFVGSPNPIQVGKTVIFSWIVNNADTVSISHPGFEALPLIGSVAVPITADMVILPPGAQTTTLTFTLTAKKNNKDSAEQITTKNFILTVTAAKPIDEGRIDTLPPDIKSFAISPATASPEDFISITWESEHVTNVSLKGSYIWNNAVYPATEANYPALPDEGSVSFLLPPAGNNPDGIEFPSGAGSVIRSYTITAENINAPVNVARGAVNSISLTTDLTVLKAPAIADSPTSDDEDSTGEIIDPGLPTDGTELISMTDDGGVSTQITDTDSGTSTVITTEDDDDADVSGSSDNAVSIIGDIDILNTGIGYSPSDTVIISDGGGGSSTDDSVNAGNNGATASISVNDIGQIVDIKLESSGYGFTKIPFISIGSKTGAGAEFRSKLKFIPVSQLLEDQDLQTVDPNKLVQVIDCPDKPLTVKIL